MIKLLERDEAAAWTEENLLPHIRAVLLASVHSTTTALTATLQFVLMHPNTQLKLVKELKTAFRSPEGVKLDALPSLPYLNATIDESLRLIPPIPLLGPRVSPGCTIDGTYVARGHELFTSLYSLHRNPQYFPDPVSFLPERWLGLDGATQKAAFQPFSTGSRSCIGKHLALQVLRLTLARLLLEFDGECVKKVLDWPSETKCYAVWEVPDIRMKFTPLPREDKVLMSDSSC
jgi:cytochrome P450